MSTSVVFLCTGNSCRSQMAEGFGKSMLPSSFDVYSAGVKPIGVDDRAVEVMRERGIDISDQTSNTLESVPDDPDLFITVCDSAARKCPTPPPETEVVHWSIDDPYFAEGTREQQLNEFRTVRDRIRSRIVDYWSDIIDENDEEEQDL